MRRVNLAAVAPIHRMIVHGERRHVAGESTVSFGGARLCRGCLDASLGATLGLAVSVLVGFDTRLAAAPIAFAVLSMPLLYARMPSGVRDAIRFGFAYSLMAVLVMVARHPESAWVATALSAWGAAFALLFVRAKRPKSPLLLPRQLSSESATVDPSNALQH
jgi:hypothetical protein